MRAALAVLVVRRALFFRREWFGAFDSKIAEITRFAATEATKQARLCYNAVQNNIT
jgi:hypothetical protein